MYFDINWGKVLRHPVETGVDTLQLCRFHPKSICPSLVMMLFSALYWLDTTASLKSIHLCIPVLKQLVANNVVQQSEEAVYLLQSVLLALQELGEHEANQSLLVGLGLQVYEALRPRFPAVEDLMLQVPGCTHDALQAFDERILQPVPGKQVPEKRKKEMFKAMISNIIGRNIGQHFMRTVFIKNLSPLFRPTRTKSADVLDSDDKTGICELFATDRPTDSSA